MRWKHPEENSDFDKNSVKVCKFCNKSFTSSLTAHLKTVHKDKFEFFGCEICNKKFFQANILEYHMKKAHSDVKNNQFECDFDGKIFKNKSEVSSHMKVHLPNVTREICKRVLTCYSIKSHMRITHKISKEFQCKICLKSFKTCTILRNHERTHNNQKVQY